MSTTQTATTSAVHSRWTNDRFWSEVVREARRFARNANRHRVYRAMKKSEIQERTSDAAPTA